MNKDIMEITFEGDHVLRLEGFLTMGPTAWEEISKAFTKCSTCDAPRVYEKPEEFSTTFTVLVEMLEALELVVSIYPDSDYLGPVYAAIAKAKKLLVSGRGTQVIGRGGREPEGILSPEMVGRLESVDDIYPESWFTVVLEALEGLEWAGCFCPAGFGGRVQRVAHLDRCQKARIALAKVRGESIDTL